MCFHCSSPLSHWLLQKPHLFFFFFFLQVLKTYERQLLLPSLVFLIYFAFSAFLIVSVLSLVMAWLHVAKDVVYDNHWYQHSQECDYW